MIRILSKLTLILILYPIGFLGENGDNIPNKEYDSILITKPVGDETSVSNYIEEMLNGTCQTFYCSLTESQIQKPMNSSMDPCNDFYEFACGNKHLRNNPFYIDTTNLIRDLNEVIENESDSKDSSVFGLVKSFYTSCMNQTEIEAVGLRQFNEILRKIGGWPLVEGDQWNETTFDWIESIRQMRNIGLNTNHLFAMEIGTDFKNSSIQSLVISQPEFKLPRNFLLNDTEPMYQKYYSSVIELAGIFGARLDPIKEQEIKDLLMFKRTLANISLPDEELRDFEAQINPFKISELEVKYPYIRWMDYFNAIMPSDMKITPDEVVIVLASRYFDRLAEVLRNTANYEYKISNFFYRILIESSKSLNGAVLGQTKLFNLISNEIVIEEQSRWSYCTLLTADALSPAIGALYVENLTNGYEELKEHATEIVEYIRSSFIDMLINATWMDENTKKMAVDKVKSTVAHIGFLKEFTDKTKLEHHYKSLSLNENEFLLNVLRVNKFEMDYEFRQLHKPFDNDKWLKYPIPATIGTFYVAQKNEILIPSAMLYGEFFSIKKPNYRNYGALGQFISHEMVHGFDDTGRQFDKNGNVKDWWTPRTKQIILSKTKCIIEQYGNFTEPITKMNVNGKLTLGENIADIVGLKSTYYAYTKWLERNNEKKPLLGFRKYTSKQLFWISAAQVWCSQIGDVNQLKLLLSSDEHSPHRFRVIGSMRNSKEFAMDFGCAPGTPMNPIEKCEIW